MSSIFILRYDITRALLIFSLLLSMLNVTDRELRKALWNGLRSEQVGDYPWMVAGDFNAITGVQEQLGCSSLDINSMEDFNDCIFDCELGDAGYIGSNFTRTDGRTLRRLDRMLYNRVWGEYFTSTTVKHLPKIKPDLSLLHRLMKFIGDPSNSWICG